MVTVFTRDGTNTNAITGNVAEVTGTKRTKAAATGPTFIAETVVPAVFLTISLTEMAVTAVATMAPGKMIKITGITAIGITGMATMMMVMTETLTNDNIRMNLLYTTPAARAAVFFVPVWSG